MLELKLRAKNLYFFLQRTRNSHAPQAVLTVRDIRATAADCTLEHSFRSIQSCRLIALLYCHHAVSARQSTYPHLLPIYRAGVACKMRREPGRAQPSSGVVLTTD